MLRESFQVKTLVAVGLVIGVSLLAGCQQASEALDDSTHSASKSIAHLLNLAALAAADDQEAVEQEVSPTATIVALVMLVIVGGGDDCGRVVSQENPAPGKSLQMYC